MSLLVQLWLHYQSQPPAEAVIWVAMEDSVPSVRRMSGTWVRKMAHTYFQSESPVVVRFLLAHQHDRQELSQPYCNERKSQRCRDEIRGRLYPQQSISQRSLAVTQA